MEGVKKIWGIFSWASKDNQVISPTSITMFHMQYHGYMITC